LRDGLQDIYLSGLSHGRINPTNMFAREAGSLAVCLGECLTSTPGKYQHHAFETIERMMADPIARGPTTSPEDIYAIGVSLLVMLFGRLPALNMSCQELLQAKIEKGSMMALLTGLKLNSAYSEFFRGLLSDDPSVRWGLDDITHWLSGRRLGSKAAAQPRKAQRAIEFNGKNYMNVRLLAHAMSQQADAGARIIEDGSLDRWLRRSIADDELAEMVTASMSTSVGGSRGGSPAERLVCKVVSTLDPTAPIRFRDISAMPTGVGPYLANLIVKGQSPKTVADLVAAQMINFWSHLPSNFNGENTAIAQVFDGQRMLLDRNQPGFGIERVMYELNLFAPCLSPMLEGRYAITLKHIAEGIEAYAQTVPENEVTREPMDRHIAAFILARHKRMNDRLFPLLDSKAERGMRAVAILNILHELQKKFHNEPMPHTTEWMGRLLIPSLDKIHNKAQREKLQKDLLKASRKGDFELLVSIADDGNIQRQDQENYDRARNEWRYWEHMAKELSSNTAEREASLLLQGRQITAFIGIFAAAAIILISLFLRLF
jgi:hypothetical protein